MNPDKLFNQLKDLHLYRAYDDEYHKLDFNSFLHFVNFFPVDAFYIVDCKHAVMHKLSSNFGKMIDDGSDQICELKPLYNHVQEDQYEKFSNFTNMLIKRSVSDPDLWVSQRDCNKSIYKARNGKTILKTTTAIKKDSNGCIIYTFGRLTDVSGLVPSTNFRYQFLGPHQKMHYAYFNDLEEFSNVLGERELEVLKYVGRGYSSKNIGEIISISKNTVDTHRRNIIHKLETNGCIEAYNKAKDMGLI